MRLKWGVAPAWLSTISSSLCKLKNEQLEYEAKRDSNGQKMLGQFGSAT